MNRIIRYFPKRKSDLIFNFYAAPLFETKSIFFYFLKNIWVFFTSRFHHPLNPVNRKSNITKPLPKYCWFDFKFDCCKQKNKNKNKKHIKIPKTKQNLYYPWDASSYNQYFIFNVHHLLCCCTYKKPYYHFLFSFSLKFKVSFL